jgi:hypothetical protein
MNRSHGPTLVARARSIPYRKLVWLNSADTYRPLVGFWNDTRAQDAARAASGFAGAWLRAGTAWAVAGANVIASAAHSATIRRSHRSGFSNWYM